MKLLLTSILVLKIVSSTYGQSCGSAVICEGFENQAGPSVSGDWKEVYPNCKGISTATIDTSVYHSGKKSLRVNGAYGYCNHIWVGSTKSLSSLGKIWFSRMYIRLSKPLPQQHIAFVAMKDANDQGKDVRIGSQSKNLAWNRENDDATIPVQSPAGIALSVPLATEKWICLEFMINGNTGEASTWVDGKEVAGLHIGNKTPEIDQQWSSNPWKPSLQDFRIGWESYGDGEDTIWFDDVALGSSRISC